MAQAREGWSWAGSGECKVAAAADAHIAHRRYKRPLDILCASILLVLCAPLAGLVAVVVKLTSPGPVLFRQQRLGYKAKPFTVLKFRTMYTDADSARHQEYFKQYLTGASAPGSVRISSSFGGIHGSREWERSFVDWGLMNSRN